MLRRPAIRRIAARAGRARSFGFGLVAQSCSAATNFGLTVIAGHALGASGLGVVLIGFAAYIFLLGFVRSLLTEPLITSSAGRDAATRSTGARSAMTIAVAGTAAAAVLLAAISTVVPDRVGRGMLLFAPWLVPALAQDLGRSIVFRDRTGPRMVLSDATWLVTMAVTAPIAVAANSDWLVVGCWGLGSATGAVVALWQIRWRPTGLRRAIGWWKTDARRLAGWLGTQALLYNVVSYVTVLALAGVLGAHDYGGLRAVQSAFAPLTLLGPALALPGLPLVSRLIGPEPRRALRVSAEIAGLITAVTALYVVALYVIPDVLGFLFGPGFVEFRDIMIPIGLGQILLAPSFGLTLFLKAAQRGRTLLWLGTLNAVVYLVLTITLGAVFGITGAAWGAVGMGTVSMTALLFVFRPATWRRLRPV